MSDSDLGMGTKAIHAGTPQDQHGAVVAPVYCASTYRLGTMERGADLYSGEAQGYVYTRMGNPTVEELENKMAALEGSGAALAGGSGMASIATAILSVVGAGDHIVALNAIFGGTTYLMNRVLAGLDIETTYVPAGANAAADIRGAIRNNTKIVYVDTPGNPIPVISDIRACAEAAHEAGALLFVDNTFATPINQSPLELGADVVLHAATKYLGGHGDALGGVICASDAFICRARGVTMRDLGGILGPFEAFLITRGIKTLHLRMAKHNENGMAIAQFLEGHPKIERSYYPGLESFEGHEIAKRQMSGFGGMVCCTVAGGLDAARRFLDSLELCVLATSLGEVNTLVIHPATTGDANRTAEERAAAGITDGLIRISVGCEDTEDIIADLDQALGKA